MRVRDEGRADKNPAHDKVVEFEARPCVLSRVGVDSRMLGARLGRQLAAGFPRRLRFLAGPALSIVILAAHRLG